MTGKEAKKVCTYMTGKEAKNRRGKKSQRQKIAEAKKCNGVPTNYCTVQLYVQLFKARAVVLSCNMIGE